jgi:predicted transcriptional regulator
MAKTLNDLRKERPGNPAAVAAHKARMLAEVRAYRLRELREQCARTQVEVAHELDVSQKRVSKIEHGDIERTQVDTLRRYVEALGGELRIEVKVGDTAYQIA